MSCARSRARRSRTKLALLLAGMMTCLWMVGCAKSSRSAPEEAPSASGASSGTSAVPVMTPPEAGAPLDNTGAQSTGPSLLGRLANESQARPKVKPSVEDVFAAFDKAGAKVGEQEQTLGKTYSASYCMGGYTSDRAIAVNVCEYANEAAATAGRDLSKKVFPGMTNRDVLARKSTTLALIQLHHDPPTDALKKKMESAFNGL